MKLCRTSLSIVIAASAVGCSTRSADESRYDYAAGWRSGKVTEVGETVTASRSSSLDCRDGDTVFRKDTKYARIEYHRHTALYVRVAPIPHDSALSVGDLVYVNVEDCSAPVPLRGSHRR